MVQDDFRETSIEENCDKDNTVLDLDGGNNFGGTREFPLDTSWGYCSLDVKH